jgi:holliday junction DNA helicase RuvA
MIAIVEGDIAAIGDNHVVVMVGGIGLQVYVSAPLRGSLRVSDRILLYTHLIVREDLLALYGFETEEERHFFNLLLGVDGVGPRLGLAVISTLSVDAVRRAVASEQGEVFSRVPGVGKRTAQKIMIHLQDKIKYDGLIEAASVGGVDESVLEALTALGYSVVEAQGAVQSIPRDAPQDIEERLRIALQYFSG